MMIIGSNTKTSKKNLEAISTISSLTRQESASTKIAEMLFT